MQAASLTPERRCLNRPFDWLLIAIERRRVKMQGLWMSQFLAMFISRRIMDARQRFYRLVERIRDGKYHPRKPAPPRQAPTTQAPTTQATEKPPRKPPPTPVDPRFKKFGWMLRLMPGTDSGHCYGALLDLFADPEMAPILAAAPKAIWREIGPLCWMVGVKRPAILAPPPKPAKPKPAKAPKRRKAKRRKSPPAHISAAQGPWHPMLSPDWPKGIVGPRRKTT